MTDTYNSVASRPIRPLPKRRLRLRLSDDANAALFAPPQQPQTPLFYFPYNNYAGDPTLGGSSGFGAGHSMDGQDSSDDEDNSSTSVSRGVGNGMSWSGDGGSGSGDPYEWTENTNNKKKRKIPAQANPGGSTNGGGSGSGGTSSSSPGFSPTSTPRSRWKPSGSSQRSPLSSMSSTNHANLRRSNRRYPPSPSSDTFRKLRDEPTTPTKSKPSSITSMDTPCGVPQQSQFTFVYESPVSANLSYSTPSSVPMANAPPDSTMSYPKVQTVGTQTSPNISSSDSSYRAPAPPAKPKLKKLSRREQFAKEQRRRRQEALHNTSGEIWICEFCEYESIFGEPPEALMRQYEIKDRKERRRLAEKRRLLEKAKQKGKKNAGKGAAKKGPAAAVPPPPAPPPLADDEDADVGPCSTAPYRVSTMVQTDACVDHAAHASSKGTSNPGGGGGDGGGGGIA